jgi:hypothetical protein
MTTFTPDVVWKASTKLMSHLLLRPKLDAHHMCAKDQDFINTARIAVILVKLVS